MESKLSFQFLCFLHLLLVFIWGGIRAQEEPNPEREALISFRTRLQNPHLLSSWNQQLYHCQWDGVMCQLGRVTVLALTSRSLKGPLSSSLSSLSSLTLLDLSSNFLFGQIPVELAELTMLRILKLGSNFFTGKIPPELGSLKALRTLELSSNGLSGTVPAQLGQLTHLEFLDLANNFLSDVGELKNLTALYIGINQFSGQLPPQIGNLSLLENFFSPSCSITGPLPEELFSLQLLTKLDLSYNPLKCSIPKSTGKLKNLSILNLVYTELNGSIPAELGNCQNLMMLMLSFNSLSGSLPEELSNLPMLTFSAEKNQLSGPLPPWLGKWIKMESLLLSSNRFSGNIPPELGGCSTLKHLSLSNNILSGQIPRELCNAESLLEIDLDGNNLSGTIENVFVKCRNLNQLVLVNNHINGSVPEYLAELPLMVIDLDSNNFTGRIPVSLWSSETLMEFSAGNNMLEGTLPVEIGNAVTLQTLVLNRNLLRGRIPKEIGNLTALSVLNLNSNFLEGYIPVEIGDCKGLTTLDLGNNNLSGPIPVELADLGLLQCLVLSHNNLSGSIPRKPSLYFHQANMPDLSFVQHHGVFDLSNNRLTGPIPEELGNCVVVVDLLLSNNMLTGNIPGSLSRLTNLTTLDLSGNVLTGSIPVEFGDSLNLQGLYLGNNRLTGTIPGSLGRVGSLVKLNLTGNKLSGVIPASFGNLKELTHLDLSRNDLTGELPSSLSQMLNLVGLYVQQNRLSGGVGNLFSNALSWKIEDMNLSNNIFNGNLPQSLGNLSYATYLDLHGNKFTGEIPSEVGNLMQLEYFDVSGNRLSGQIPERVCGMFNLFYLNLAENRLEGPVPRTGICQNLSRTFLSGNSDLCGRIMGLECQIRSFDRSSLLSAWGLAAVTAASVFIIFTSAFALRRWIMSSSQQCDPEEIEESKLKSFIDQELYFLSSSRSKEPLSINIATFEQPLLKLTLGDILEGTSHFCKTNVIGDGGFGTVYKAKLPSGKTVAVKKLSQAKTQGHREFIAEMETLGKVKHQNLVPLLGYCSLAEEKLLVYEYMINGSLDLWLRNRTGALDVLDWSKRFKIAIGAARGLAFLHHGFIPHIIHRDIKASNILLSEDFEPKVADFGLARLISACETHVTTDIAGTLGYIPPEYGQSGRCTTKGDVYSFGVILLELVTGKEPTGPDFKEIEGGNLVGWVSKKMRMGEAADVLDAMVLNVDSKQMMLKVLSIAEVCLSENPANRPTMLHVLKLLKGIKEDYLSFY
ncbi:leucine-rich repeat receptor protein kinase EMS1-like isoform X2 [Gossypium arboreum]|uniref:leucine-rich repeat receptor protein kinase EMS1-like isoform X2 n=1 Tax=Gossypium arboreum TaxID=29729 RepID=UPI0022F18B77|nr:leucine-rich repeat receptor protein kinase EMS1-like isoform X2 [Gossypium arboreum]